MFEMMRAISKRRLFAISACLGCLVTLNTDHGMVAEDASGMDPATVARQAFDALDTAGKPAIAVLVSRDGKVLFRHVVGMADIENQIAATPETKFRIGSVTKQFTASAILKLVDADKIQLNDPLSKFLPDFPRGQDVTIEHLLHHTSGIPSFTGFPEFLETVTEATTEEELIASFAGKPLEFEPGTEFRYNNSGYFLLGHLVRLVSGQTLADFCQGEFFDPLGMANTGFHTPDPDRANEALGYSMMDGVIEPALDWHMTRAGGAGAMYSTLDDLMRWNEAVFAGNVLPPELMEKAFTPSDISVGDMNYGYGWSITKIRGLHEISHNGGLQGWQSDLTRYRDQNVNIVVLENSLPTAYPGMEPEVVTQRMRDLFLKDDMEPIPTRVVDETVDAEVMERYVGSYDYGTAVMVVQRDGDRLTAQLTGQPAMQIYPEDERHFFWKIVDAQVEFLVDGEGKCIAVQHSQNGRSFRADRIPDVETVELSTAQLDSVTGRYDYGGPILKLRRDGTQLLAQLSGQPEMPVFPVDENTFRWRVVAAEIKILRDSENNVTAVQHSQGGQTFKAPRLGDL